MRITFALAFIAASASAVDLLKRDDTPCVKEYDHFEGCRFYAWLHKGDTYEECISQALALAMKECKGRRDWSACEDAAFGRFLDTTQEYECLLDDENPCRCAVIKPAGEH